MAVATLLSIGLPGPAGQDAAANAADQPQVRTWTDRSGEHQTEASLVDSQDGKVMLKKKDGTTITVPLESLSDADRDYVRGSLPPEKNASASVEEPRPVTQPRRGAAPPKRGHNVADIVPGGGKGPAHAALPAGRELVVTGVGTDPDKAVQNAFSQVIEQTVGVLVDADTVVKNDQLIRDEVLTYSRGYVEKYEVLKRWQEDGLHHATIRAVVARDKLAKKLRAIKISVQDVPGELASRQIEFDVKNDEQAAELLKKALAGFDMTKLTKAEIVGEPEITRDGANAKVRVKVKVSPDFDQWKTLSKNLRSVLTKTSVKRASVSATSTTVTGGFLFANDVREEALRRQLEGEGILVSLFDRSNVGGNQAQWEVFRVPGSMGAPIRDAARKMYRLTYSLFDARGGTVLCTHAPIQDKLFHIDLVPFQDHVPSLKLGWHDREWWWMGPVWFRGYPNWITFYDAENTIALSQQDLRKVAKVSVVLEEDTKDGAHSSTDAPFRRGR